MSDSFLYSKKGGFFVLNTKILTEQELAILEFVGYESRVNKDEIRRVFELDDRTFYAIAEKIRRKGFWLLASKEKGNSGYYYVTDRTLFNYWADKQYKMLQSNLKTIEAMRNSDGKGNNIDEKGKEK